MTTLERAGLFATNSLASQRSPEIKMSDVTGDVLHRDPADSLCGADFDLLVVGSGGHGRLVGALLGSISAHLAHHSRIPLVIVPNPSQPGHPA